MTKQRTDHWDYATEWAAKVPFAYMFENVVCPCLVLRGSNGKIAGAFCGWDIRNEEQYSRVETDLLSYLETVESVVLMQAEPEDVIRYIRNLQDGLPPAPENVDGSRGCSFCGAKQVRRISSGEKSICGSCIGRLQNAARESDAKGCDFCTSAERAEWSVEDNGVRICCNCLDLIKDIVEEEGWSESE